MGEGEDMQAAFLSFWGGIVILRQGGSVMLNLPHACFFLTFP